MRVIGAHKNALMAPQLLKTYPDVCLDVFHKVADVNVAVGIGQRGRDEDLTRHSGTFRSTKIA
jgi:hypothetical protein